MASQYQQHHDSDHHDHLRHHRQTAKLPAVSITRTLNIQPKTVQLPKNHNTTTTNSSCINFVLDLSNLDRQCPSLMYTVFFYKPSYHHPRNNVSVFSSLKVGSEETLSLWYPASGRLMVNPNNNNKLDLWCNNRGAVLAEAVTQVKISELGDDLSQYNEFFENLVYKPCSDAGNISEMPLLVAQVTAFGCGGYTVGIGTSHALFDGPAAYNFFSAWASNANTVNLISASKLKPWEKPFHDRGRLLLVSSSSSYNHQQDIPRAHNADQSKYPGTMVNNYPVAAAIEDLYKLVAQAAYEAGGFHALGQNHDSSCVLKTFHLSGSMIESLKRKMSPSSTSSCSSFEILAAHLWKGKTKAFAINKQKLVCLHFSVDIRTRVTPPLPQSFSGNAFVLASVAMTASQLEQEPLESIVQKIRAAKRSIDHNYVSSYTNSLGQGSGQQGSPLGLRELTMVSDWTRMPLHKVNFANGDNADYACPLMGPLPQTAYFMQSPKDGSGVDVRIGLSPQVIGAFSYYFLQGLY